MFHEGPSNLYPQYCNGREDYTGTHGNIIFNQNVAKWKSAVVK